MDYLDINVTLDNVAKIGDSFNIITALVAMASVYLLLKSIKQINQQNFNNQFFSLLNMLNSRRDNILFNKEKKQLLQVIITTKKPEKDTDPFYSDDLTITGEFYKEHRKPKKLKEFKEVYKNLNNDILENYFLELYQLLLFIDDEDKNIANKYMSIIKTKLSKDELILLFYNTVLYDDYNYKNLLEKYTFFETINSDDLYYSNEMQSDNGLPLAKDIINKYNINIFGENKSILDFIKDKPPT